MVRLLWVLLVVLSFSLACNSAYGELETVRAGAKTHMRYLVKLANAESADGVAGGPARPAPPKTTLAEWVKRNGAEYKRLKGLKDTKGMEASSELGKLLSLLDKMEKDTGSESFNEWANQANALAKKVDDKFSKL